MKLNSLCCRQVYFFLNADHFKGLQVRCQPCEEHALGSPSCFHHLFGLVVKASALRGEDPGFESCLQHHFSRSSHTSGLKIGTPVATLPGAWCYRVSAGTGQPSVSKLWLGEVESLICSFYPSVAAYKLVWADLSLRYISMLLGCLLTNKQQQPLPFPSWVIPVS